MQQAQDSKKPSFSQRSETSQNPVIYPALTIMVILRRDLGYRLVDLGRLIPVTLFLVIASLVLQAFHPGSRNGLFPFAVVSFCFGFYQRIKRWRDVNNTVKQHSFYIGTSPFAFAWLPAFLHRNRRIARYIEPLFCGFVGFIALYISPSLGLWLMLSGASLYIIEGEVHTRERERQLDMVDGIIVGENHADVIEKFEAPKQAQAHPHDGRIPTGIADDIERQLKRRRASNSPQRKEN